MGSRKNTRTILLVILASSFVVRMLLILWFHTYEHPVPWEYEKIAGNLLAGRGYSIEHRATTYLSFNTPLFGLLCAIVYYLTNHSFFLILVIQSLFTILLATVIFAIAKTIFEEKVGVLAAAATAFHPGFVYYDVFNLLPLSIDSFLIALVTFLWLNFRSRVTFKRISLIGALIGIAVLSRGIIGMLLPLIATYFLLFARPLRLVHRLKIVTCLLAACFIVLMPWLIRNYRIHNRFVFIASSSAENFWRGNNPYATGTSTNDRAVQIFRLTSPEFQNQVFARNEMQQQDFFMSEALRFIRDRPADAARLYVKKIYYFWWFSPQSGVFYSPKYLLIYKTGYAIIIGFSVVGVAFAMRSRRPGVRKSCLILLSVMIVICLGQSVFYVEGRHRWLIEPIILIFFSFAVVQLWTKAREWQVQRRQASVFSDRVGSVRL